MTPEIYIALLIVLSLASAVLVRIQARAAYALGYAEGRRDAWVKAASEVEHAQKDALRSARQPHIRRLAAIEAEKAEEELKLKRAERERADTLNKQLKRTAFELAKLRADDKVVGVLGVDALNEQLKRELGLTHKAQ